MTSPFQPFTYAGCANPKKERSDEERYGLGKYLYDVFYEECGELFTGSVRGDNMKHAKENFIMIYGELKINHFQRLPLGW